MRRCGHIRFVYGCEDCEYDEYLFDLEEVEE